MDKRIAFITSQFDKSTQWQWFSEELIKRGIEHIHITIKDKKPQIVQDLEDLGVTVYYLQHKNTSSHFFNLMRIVKILRKHKINIVHTELPLGNLLGQTAGRIAGISKRFTTCENATWAFDYNMAGQKFIDGFSYKAAKKVVVLTELSKDFIVEKFNISPQKIVTIGHSLKVEEYTGIGSERVKRLKDQLHIKDGDFIIGMVARLETWKGHQYAIEAINQIRNEIPQVKLLIFGQKGESYEKTIQLIKALKLEEIVQFGGLVNDNIALYKCFDIHLHVPINIMVETFGITIIEGMISEVPQILTKSGVSYFISNEENAMIVDYCNSTQIAEAIRLLYQQPGKGRTIAAQAKQDVLEKYSYKTKVEQHLALYDSI